MTDAHGGRRQAADGCGDGGDPAAATPLPTANPPGLAAVAYRVGTWAEFRASLLARLSRRGDREPALAALTTRAGDDFAVALYDALSCALDVLTFYSERSVNEYFLRTATERRSVLELARAIGYQLGPGVSATAYLAFALDDTPGAPAVATIPAGSKVQTTPEPGQLAQTFETSAAIEARVAWNAMRPRRTRRHPLKEDGVVLTRYLLEGTMTGLRAGDGIVVVPEDDGKPVFFTVASVAVQADRGRTALRVSWVPTGLEVLVRTALKNSLSPALSYAASAGLAGTVNKQLGVGPTAAAAAAASGAARAAGAAAPAAAGATTVGSVALTTAAAVHRFGIGAYLSNLAATRRPPPGILALRVRAAVFGHNAPRLETLPASLTGWELIQVPDDDSYTYTIKRGPYNGRTGPTWAEGTLKSNHIAPGAAQVFLDATYPGITRDSWIVLRDAARPTRAWSLHAVTEAGDVSVADFALNGKVTRLQLDDASDLDAFSIRGTTVYGQSEVLPLARLPITDDVGGATIEIEGGVAGLAAGQTLIVRGEPATDPGLDVAEVVVVREVRYATDPADGGYTIVALRDALRRVYRRETVTIYGNVVQATHGETKHELLGSGDASRAFQRFVLRQSPLTHTSAPTPSGLASTLQVNVDDIRWHEVPFLEGHGPDERVYTVRTDDDGQTTVQFGDGRTAGARLPTGRDNVRAVLRTGTGLAGLAAVDQLTTLMSRPAGVRGVTNPLPAAGADDPESRDAARQNAPLHVRTLERIVSLRDHEDFARAFGGVARALATWTWDGQRRGVLITVAGPEGADIADESPIRRSLLDAIARAGDPYVPVLVRSYGRRMFRLVADVAIDPDHQTERVEAAVRAALVAGFSFGARDFGQPVFLSEVVGTIQAVRGVVGVNLRALYRSYPAGDPPGLNRRLAAALPRPGTREPSPAELLLLAPGGAELAVSR